MVNFELPGVPEKEISLSVTGDLLTVNGECQFNYQLRDHNYLHAQRAYGKFERFGPTAHARAGGASDRHLPQWVLEIRLPKAEQASPKEITIDVS